MPFVPWSQYEPAEYSYPFALDGGGREIVDKVLEHFLDNQGSISVLEVGTFLGQSLKRWLDVSPRINAIACDLFEFDSSSVKTYKDIQADWAAGQFTKFDAERLYQELDKENGALRCFMRNLYDYRDRVKIYRGDFTKEASEIANSCQVDVIYLDADKSRELLDICYHYFPHALLTGDDWTWGPDKNGVFPMQEAVKSFCANHGFKWNAIGATWIIYR